jgi:protein phosphatase
MKFAVKTDIGQKRERNEDSYNIIVNNDKAPVSFIIADGMGGHNSGEIASRLAVDFVSNYITSNPDEFSVESEISEKISALIAKANDLIIDNAKRNEKNSGMGTTIIVSMVLNNKIYIGNVGDSRAYLIRNGKIEQITVDHSYIEELLKSGSITKEEAVNHPQKNIITRALGSSKEVKADTFSVELQKKDSILFCTDGLTNMLNDDEILKAITESKEPEEICQKLIKGSIANGGEDNITVIIIREF